MIVPIFLRFYRRLRIKAAGEAVQKEVEEKDYHRLTNRAEKAVIEDVYKRQGEYTGRWRCGR